MTRKQRFKKLGWRVEKIILDSDYEDYKKGEWLGFWQLIAPDGSIPKGWQLPDTARGEKQYEPNCFDGTDEAWEYAGK